MTKMGLRAVILLDRRANPRDPKAQLLLAFFRIAQYARSGARRPFQGRALEYSYRLFSEWLLGIELRPKTEVGPGLSIFHGVGLVVNDHVKIGRNVVLRNGVTIGHQVPNGGCPILEDDVDVGANAVIVGEVTIGRGARIGAGAVVTKSVPAGGVAMGNPAVIRIPG